jgi:hypothetical protein
MLGLRKVRPLIPLQNYSTLEKKRFSSGSSLLHQALAARCIYPSMQTKVSAGMHARPAVEVRLHAATISLHITHVTRDRFLSFLSHTRTHAHTHTHSLSSWKSLLLAARCHCQPASGDRLRQPPKRALCPLL